MRKQKRNMKPPNRQENRENNMCGVQLSESALHYLLFFILDKLYYKKYFGLNMHMTLSRNRRDFKTIRRFKIISYIIITFSIISFLNNDFQAF